MVAHSTCSRPRLGFFKNRIELGWEHNYSLDGPNQWITHLRSNQHQMRAEDNEKKKRTREWYFLDGDTLHFLFPPATRRIGEETSSQAAKERTILSAKPGSRRCQAAALSSHLDGDFWKQQEMMLVSIQGWLNLMSHCPPAPLELWFQPSALQSCVAKCN